MIRRIGAGACLGGLGFALTVLAAYPGPVAAASAAREKAALTMLGFVGGQGPPLPDRQPPPPVPLTPDAFMVIDAWRSAGVRVDRAQADYRRLEQACMVARTPDTGQPGPDPQPGDFLLYDSSQVNAPPPALHPRRVAMFVSPVEVVYWDDIQQRVQRAMAARLLPSHRLTDGEASLVANSSTDVLCRLPPGDWPGGERPAEGWRYALADPGYIAEQHQWTAAHPRDADISPLHPVVVAFTSVVAPISGALSSLVGAVQGAVGWLLNHLGLPGSALLGAAGLLGTEFDGRRLHRFLVGVLLLPLVVTNPGAARLVVGLVRGRSPRELHIAREGVPTRLLLGGAEFTVDTLTGIEDSRHVRAGMVVFALASDFLVFGKLAALGRIAASGARRAVPHALSVLPPQARLRLQAGAQRCLILGRSGGPLRGAALVARRRSLRLLDLAGDTSDLVAVRPETVGRALHSIGGARSGLSSGGHLVSEGRAAAAPPSVPVFDISPERAPGLHAIARVSGDAVSWAWRGHSATNDVIGHLGRYSAFADASLRSGGRPWGVRTLRAAWIPIQRRFPTLAARLARHATERGVPTVVRGARLVHLNSEAHSAARLLSGQAPPPLTPAHPPTSLHLTVANEVRRAAELRAQLDR